MVGALPLFVGVAHASVRAAPREGEAPPETAPLVVVLVPDLPESTSDEEGLVTINGRLREAKVRAEVLRRPDTSFSLSRMANESPAVSRELSARMLVWIDLTRSAGYELVVYDPQAAKQSGGLGLFRRKVPFGDAQRSAGIESLANILDALLDALGQGEVLALDEVTAKDVEEDAAAKEVVEAPDAQPDAAAPVVEAPAVVETVVEPVEAADNRHRWPRFELRLAYQPSTIARNQALEHGAAVAGYWRPRERMLIGLQYTLVSATRVDSAAMEMGLPALVGLVVSRHPVSLLLARRWPVRPNWNLELSGVGGVDPIRRISRVPRGPMQQEGPIRASNQDQWHLTGFLGGRFGAAWQASPWLALYSEIGFEAVLGRHRYVVTGPEDVSEVLLTPAALRVSAALGIRFGMNER